MAGRGNHAAFIILLGFVYKSMAIGHCTGTIENTYKPRTHLSFLGVVPFCSPPYDAPGRFQNLCANECQGASINHNAYRRAMRFPKYYS